jgi:peptidoglycan/LPS O-acetylase OafA/YrhL
MLLLVVKSARPRPHPTAAASAAHDNNFDTLRLLAAFAVVCSHAFPLSYGSDETEPVFQATRQQTTLGGIAVAVFFIISGYLITQSYTRTRDPRRFILARALRLLPGLAAVLTLLALILGPLLTTEPLPAYFSAPQTFRFVFGNLALLTFTDGLPGVFATVPYRNAVDGSLWTLGYEAACYLLVLCLGLAGLLNRWIVLTLFFASLVASKYWIGGDMVQFGSFFLGGAAICLWRPRLRLTLAVLSLIVMAAALSTGGFRLAAATAGAYLVLYLALGPLRLPRWDGTDISYGVYIWAFPVQQTVALASGAHAAWWSNLLISFPVITGLAWLSWHLIEAPALSLRHARWIAARAPVP